MFGAAVEILLGILLALLAGCKGVTITTPIIENWRIDGDSSIPSAVYRKDSSSAACDLTVPRIGAILFA
jgi:hypothetical protein